MEKMGKKLNVNEIMKAYEMLSKEDKDLFENEIQNKKEEQYALLRQERHEKVKSAKNEREAELDAMEKEIPVLLKQVAKKLEPLLEYDTFEGELLHAWPYLGSWRFVRPNSRSGETYDFYYDTLYHSEGHLTDHSAGIGYIRGKGFSFIYDNDGRPCTRIRVQHEIICSCLRTLDQERDEIMRIIDIHINSLIKSSRNADRDAKQSHYKF